MNKLPALVYAPVIAPRKLFTYLHTGLIGACGYYKLEDWWLSHLADNSW